MNKNNPPLNPGARRGFFQRLKGLDWFAWSVTSGAVMASFVLGFFLGRWSVPSAEAAYTFNEKAEQVEEMADPKLVATHSSVSTSPPVKKELLPSSRKMAPDFSLKDVKGTVVSLSDYKGKVVFLEFWATWCPPCRISMPEVEELYSHYRGKAVEFIGINLDEDEESVSRFLKKYKIPFPVVLAGQSDVSVAYQADGIPFFVLIDQDGGLVQEWPGFYPGMNKEWKTEIDKLLTK